MEVNSTTEQKQRIVDVFTISSRDVSIDCKTLDEATTKMKALSKLGVKTICFQKNRRVYYPGDEGY